jgi:hypothetical protein
MNELNNTRRRSYSPTQIACRLCDNVFMSTQALINHIESHMGEEEATSRMQHRTNRLPIPSQRDICANPFQPNFALPIPPRETQQLFENRLPVMQPLAPPERHPFYGLNRMIVPRPTLPPLVSPMARNNFAVPPQFILSAEQAQRRMVEEPSGDCTKPYLNQLDHPIMKLVDVTDSNDDNNSISGLNKLDLALKL